MKLPRGYLSVSQIKLYLQCPHKYMKKYVEGIPEPVTGPQIEGIVWSKTMEEICKGRLKKNKWHSLKDTVKIWEKHWANESVTVDQWQGTRPDDAGERARKFLRQLWTPEGPKLHPAMYDGRPGVELETDCTIAGIPFKIIPDLIEYHDNEWRILDFKISNPDYQDAERSIQLTIEAAVFEIEKVTLLVGDKRYSNLVWINSTRDIEGAWKFSEKLVTTVAEGISKGVFPLTNPELNTLCSKKFCSQWANCLGGMGF